MAHDLSVHPDSLRSWVRQDEAEDGTLAAHERSQGIYGAPRIRAELALTHSEHVSRKRVAYLMVNLGLEGVSRQGRRRARSAEMEMLATPDLVRRQFTASASNELWIHDFERHEGPFYRVEAKGLHLRVVAAARMKLRAA